MNPFIIAEIGVNHDGCQEKAIKLIEASAQAGAHAAKFQSFTSEALVSPNAQRAPYQERNCEGSATQLEMLKKLELDRKTILSLAKQAESYEIEFMSSPFDVENLKFLLNDVGMSRIKIGSGEITNLPLLIEAGKSDAPIVLSTGMSRLSEIELALGAIAWGQTNSSGQVRSTHEIEECYDEAMMSGFLAERVTLLHCTTEYPCPPKSVNLRAMATLHQAFGLPVGFSDHSLGINAALIASALGASLIEKHITLNKNDDGPDHKCSLEPAEFLAMVQGIEESMSFLGIPRKFIQVDERANKVAARKSIVARRAMPIGHQLTIEDLDTRRPEAAVPASRIFDIIGTRLGRNYDAGEFLERE